MKTQTTPSEAFSRCIKSKLVCGVGRMSLVVMIPATWSLSAVEENEANPQSQEMGREYARDIMIPKSRFPQG